MVLDSPRGNNGHFGGPVSAPIFKRIAEQTLQYLRVPPTINPASPVLVASNSHPHEADTPSGTPTSTKVDEGPLPLQEDEPGTVPDVRGMSLRATRCEADALPAWRPRARATAS